MKKLTKALCSLAAVTLLGSTALTVQAASEIEPNNTKGTATKIAVGEKASAKLSDDKDVDWYSFEITKSGYFYLDDTGVKSHTGSKLSELFAGCGTKLH